mmetsp:Transcript_10873/g.30797  ORF Transcript_10873/g.30797 Transcript_10873/m.30797 type:complete len:254 (-) Transcript_10873:315-1076(-)
MARVDLPKVAPPARKSSDTAGKKPPLAEQSQAPLATALTALLVLWGVVQQYRSEASFGLVQLSCVLGVSYLYTDYWLWMLHCFLDRKENLASRISAIAGLAKNFQDHHDVPATLLVGNHFGEIDGLVTAMGALGLALGAWTSPSTKFIVAMVTVWGGLGGLNHFYGHAITHGYKVPPLYEYGQRWGLLPTAKHHKQHHTAPFEENWNFLNGLHGVLYEPLYFAGGSSYKALFGMFYSLNPICIQVLALAAGLV